MSSTVQSESGWLPDQYFSGGLSISGLTESGSDFKSMIEQLRKIEMIPTQRMLRWKSEWQARQEAFGLVRESLTNLRDICSKMNSMDKFLVKKATSSQPNFATATASSSAIENSYKLEVDRVASTSIWSLKGTFADAKTPVNRSNTDSGTFSYEYNGTVRTLSVAPNTTLEAFKNMINNDVKNPGIRASIIKGANGVTLQIKGMDQGEKHDLAILSTSGLDSSIFPPAGDYGNHSLSYTTKVPSSKITDGSEEKYRANTNSVAQTFTYSYNGYTRDVSIPGHASIQQFVTAINNDISTFKASLPTAEQANFDLSVSIDTSGEYAKINFNGNNAGAAVVAPKGTGSFENIGQGTTTSGDPAVNANPDIGWTIQHSENARIKVDGWPDNYLEVSSNVVSDVVEGVTFNLIGEGTTTVSVTTDAEAVTENVVSFIDAMNEFRSVVNELTKFDANKTTVDYNYAYSQFEMQKGSILTGNYGIQMISSRIKQATAGMPKGFLPQYKSGDLMLGDLYTSLSQMGIKTKADGSGGDGFGLLELNTDPKLPLLEDVLKNNPEAVAEFFAAVNKGVSDSYDFSYSSSMQNITRPGSYEVKYELDGNGKVIDGTAFINGKPAKYDSTANQIGIYRTGPESSDSSKVSATTDGTLDFDVDIKVLQTAQHASTTLQTQMTSGADPFAATNGKIRYTYGDPPNQHLHEVEVTAGDSLGTIAGKINYSLGKHADVRASVATNDAGEAYLKIENMVDGEGAAKIGNLAWDFAVESAAGATGVSTQAATNAKYKMANPSGSANYQEYTSKTNTVTDRIKGVTFTLSKTNVTQAEYDDDANANRGTRIKGDKHNDADGTVVQIDNVTPNASYSGTLRIKQGKVNEILELLNGLPNKPEEGILGSKGTLQVLVDNYNKIIAGIDSKIERETDRLIKWERTIKLRFSRLEATIKQYESLQASIESQVKQLGSSSSK